MRVSEQPHIGITQCLSPVIKVGVAEDGSLDERPSVAFQHLSILVSGGAADVESDFGHLCEHPELVEELESTREEHAAATVHVLCRLVILL